MTGIRVLIGGLLLTTIGLMLHHGSVVGAEITGKEVSYEVDGVRLTGFLAYDASARDPRPGVLVVHEWWGHNQYVRDRALMLAEMGYTAFALDMYGDGKLATHPGDANKFMTEVFNNMSAGKARFEAAREVLASHSSTDADRIAAIGYCFGGAIVLHMARGGMDLAGVASFHGNLSTRVPAQPGSIKADILVLHGADDQLVPPEQVAAFKEEMRAAGAEMQFINYPGAMHGFTNPQATQKGEKFDLPLAYDKEADEASWSELEKFLKNVFRN